MIRKILRLLRLRIQRRRLQLRAIFKLRELTLRHDRTENIKPNDILLFLTVRNEHVRLPFFFDYYRKIGVNHFLVVDNNSDDGTAEYLEKQQDISVWHTTASYKHARFGMDWLNALLRRYGRNHWTITVDADEFFVFPHCDVRPVRALTDWLDNSSVKSIGAMLLDMYSEKPLGEGEYHSGQNPFDELSWFDAGNYSFKLDKLHSNLWVQGGPRMRAFFANRPAAAPALNKIPLVRWQKGYVYFSSTHSLLPRGLNRVYDEWGGEKVSGCLLHAKFLCDISKKSVEELDRRQHYAGSREYKAYLSGVEEGKSLWTPSSVRYKDWRQLEQIGLMSAGGWI